MKITKSLLNKSFLLMAIALVNVAPFSAVEAGQQKLLVSTHMGADVQCVACHESWESNVSKVNVDTCLGCHDGYEGMAEQTKNVRPNPHSSHLGDTKCTECHKIHEVSKQTFCDMCHNFGQKLP